MPPDSPFEGAPLPVPYENPWGLLARDSRAVAASLRLQAREVWRRNRQGDLRRPGFWPKDLAPLFWPLALALAVALLILLVVGGTQVLAPGPAGVAPVAEGAVGEPNTALPAPRVVEPLAAESLAAETLDAASVSEAAQAPAPLATAPLLLESDPLGEAMGQLDPGPWITALDPDQERGTLTLVLAGPFTALPEAQQLQQAEIWQTQAIALGFDRLELTDRQGRPIGRQARVGSGMILLTPQHLS